MKTKLAIMTSVGLAAGLVSGCGTEQGGSAAISPPTNTSQSLNTAQVLAQAKAASDTSAPYAVNAGALTLTDTSETSEPISVDGM